MATSADGFGISLAFYFGFMFICFALFSYWRRVTWTEKFYAKKAFFPPLGYRAPPIIPRTKRIWAGMVARMSEGQVLASGGMDALMYLKTMRFSMEVFALVTLFVSAVILPINLTSDNVDYLTQNPYDPAKISEYIRFYLPDLNGTAATDAEEADEEAVDVIEAPEIYNKSIPPAPPGLIWWERLPNIPPLPPVTALGPEYENYTWIYDEDYKVVKYDLTDLDKTTMTNVPTKSDKLYAHAIMTWFLTILVLWRLRVYCQKALNLRIKHFQDCPRGAETHSILCTDIPGVVSQPPSEDGAAPKESWFQKFIDKRMNAKHGKRKESTLATVEPLLNSVVDKDIDVILPDRWEEAVTKMGASGKSAEWLVKEEFQDLYKDDFESCHLVYDTTELSALVGQYEKAKAKAYHAVDVNVSQHMNAKKKVKPQKVLVAGPTMGKWGMEKYGKKPQKVDAFEFYVDRLEYLRSEILKEQVEAKKKEYPAAFVSFKTRRTQVIASQVMMSEDLSTWVTKPAPQPEEIIWNNLRMRSAERQIRQKMYIIFFWLLMAFYMIPVAAVQVLISTNSLVGWMQSIPIASSLLTGILPGLALRIFLILLPKILTSMLKMAGVVAGSQLDLGLVSYMYIFQFVTVFIGSFISGIFANQFEQLIDDPGSIVQIFGTAAPQVGIFFMTYILVQACFEIPLDIFDIVGLIIFKLKLAIAATDNAKERLMKSKEAFKYGKIIPDDSIVFLLGLSFSIACPLIAPIALIYFATRYLVNKYNLVYRSEGNYQSGGQSWLRVHDQYIACLVSFQILMIFILAIKEMIGPPIIVLPLPFITLGIGVGNKARYTRPMASLSLLLAEDRDRQEQGKAASLEDAPENAYLSPLFTFDEDDHTEVMNQCRLLRDAHAAGDFAPLSELANPSLEPLNQAEQASEERFHDIETSENASDAHIPEKN
ncbi:hypothetical protein M9434_003937 [Picochlorum sp. BPE23]|nr:hypothetical protein M9434_003937 [Picochlorum sp. BPE23]